MKHLKKFENYQDDMKRVSDNITKSTKQSGYTVHIPEGAKFDCIEDRLDSLNMESINNLLNDVYESDDLDERMELIDQILVELEANDIELSSEEEDELKDIAIG